MLIVDAETRDCSLRFNRRPSPHQAGRRGFDPRLPLLESVVCNPSIFHKFPFTPLTKLAAKIRVSFRQGDVESRGVVRLHGSPFCDVQLGVAVCVLRDVDRFVIYRIPTKVSPIKRFGSVEGTEIGRMRARYLILEFIVSRVFASSKASTSSRRASYFSSQK